MMERVTTLLAASLAPQQRGGVGEDEVEEQHEVAPRGGRHVGGGAGRGGEVEHLEAADRHLLAPVEDLEVGGGEAAHRLAAIDHLHRHLDHHHVGALGERLLGGARGRVGEGQAEHRHRGGETMQSETVWHGVTSSSHSSRGSGELVGGSGLAVSRRRHSSHSLIE